MTGQRRDLIGIYLEHSAECLAAGEILLESQLLLRAISNCYYAVFYAASAMLLSKGIERARHSGVHSALGEYLVKTGEVPAEMSDLFTRLRSEHEAADYDMVYLPGAEIAWKRLQQARAFVNMAQDYLRHRGFLDD